MKSIVALALFALAGSAWAQVPTYPARPIRLVVPYAAGGPVDIVARIVGQKLTEAYGQQVIVDSRGGGGGNIGLEIVAHAAPDGYTLLMGANGVIAINPSLYKNLPVNTEKDLAPVGMVASSAMIVVVHPSVPAASIKDLIALARARPGAINYASSGSGSTAHLATELLKNMAKVDMTHIPYKGAGPALADVMAGQVQAMITAVSTTLPYVKSGKLKALAVSSENRLPLLPEMPTVAETLPGYEVSTWYGVFAPAATSRAIVERLNATLVSAFAAPDAQARLSALGADARTGTPEQLGQAARREKAKWAKLVKESGARVE
jgi:tripartite-type tricarboxylate transporter receptor subunit TctC